LTEIQDVLREIQEARNSAAHAAVDGRPRELEATDLDRLSDGVTDFIVFLFDSRLGFRAGVASQ
jgi:hypothetical protein